MTRRETRRWRGVGGVALAAGAIGVIANRPTVLLLAVVGVVFAAYPQLARRPEVTLDIERRVSDQTPRPGEDVTVTVTVRNVGERTLPDLRIVDGVPSTLPVTDGTPRLATALRPGGAATFSYDVATIEGTHVFDPATVIARDLSGAIEVETTAATETEISCTNDLGQVPLRARTAQMVGRVVTDDGGSGIEFHGTREYRPGDPVNRIDWNRHARTGELATVEFRTERAASVLLLVDARHEAYCSAREDDLHAVAYCVAAAESLFYSLLASRDLVGLAALGRERCALAPSSGSHHRARAAALISTHPALSSVPAPEGSYDPSQLAELRAGLSTDTQVVFLSPLCDDYPVTAAQTLEAYGHAVTVLTPNVTSSGTLGARLARVERDNRLAVLRRVGIRVIDWDPGMPLRAALDQGVIRWTA